MSTTGTLLDMARGGWSAEEPDVALGVLSKIRKSLRAGVEVLETRRDSLSFIADMGRLRLRGANETACLLVSGQGAGLDSEVSRFWDGVSGPEQLVIVFALSDAALASALRVVPNGYGCVLGPAEVAELVQIDDSLVKVKEALRRQVPLRRLIPFQNKHAVWGNMFYGRRSEVQDLLEQDTTNFAIAGQGRIGKSSLIEQYKRHLKSKDPKRTHLQFVDFYTCPTRSEADVAQFLARCIEGGETARTKTMSPPGLEPFIRYHAHRNNRKFNFVFDEVDAVCKSRTFMILFHLAKKDGPISRIVLAGKRELLRQVSAGDTPLGMHVSPIRLEPLDEESASRLLIEPMADMELRFAEEKTAVDRILRLTGRLPQMIQYFGLSLARAACAAETNILTGNHIEMIRTSEETKNLFMSPLRDVEDPLAELIALMILERSISTVDFGLVIRLAESAEIKIDLEYAQRVCEDLLLSNFLAWTKTGYQVANEAIGQWARDINYLETALPIARRKVQQRSYR